MTELIIPVSDKAWLWSRNGSPHIKAVEIFTDDDDAIIGGITRARGVSLENAGLRLSAEDMDAVALAWMKHRKKDLHVRCWVPDYAAFIGDGVPPVKLDATYKPWVVGHIDPEMLTDGALHEVVDAFFKETRGFSNGGALSLYAFMDNRGYVVFAPTFTPFIVRTK